MKFKTHNDKNIVAAWTSLQGMIDIDFKTLCNTFGEYSDSDGYKTDAEWDIEFEDGTIATIYNYKDGKNYDKKNGIPTEEIREWHIGGNDKRAVELVKEVLKIV